MVQVLCRRRKNNPLLVGEAGVGKTAIAEGLAWRITRGEVDYQKITGTVLDAGRAGAANLQPGSVIPAAAVNDRGHNDENRSGTWIQSR